MLDISTLQQAWAQVEALTHDAVAPIETEAQHEQALTTLDALLVEVGEDGQHPLGNLVRLLIERVTAYEALAHPIPEATPAQMLAFYLDQRGLTQTVLAAATGIDQAQISKLLRGKRAFNADQARVLGQYFRVSPAMFL